MSSVNKVILLGHLGADPQGFITRSTKQGAKFRLATADAWLNEQGERKERTAWHNITCYGKLASTCLEHLAKGRQVQVEGRIQYSSYTDKAGNKRTSTEIVAETVTFLGGAKGERSKPAAEATA